MSMYLRFVMNHIGFINHGNVIYLYVLWRYTDLVGSLDMQAEQFHAIRL